MKLLKYKGIIFDDWTEDECGTWAKICPSCLKQYDGRMDVEIDSSGSGHCSVRGCGQKDDKELDTKYIDFDINGVEIFEETIEDSIKNLKRDGIALTEISEELCYREHASSDSRWDDNLYDYSTEELEEIETKWEVVD